MPRKIHMQDQVGYNKVEEIMSHNYGQSSLELWMTKLAVMGLFVALGIDWCAKGLIELAHFMLSEMCRIS